MKKLIWGLALVMAAGLPFLAIVAPQPAAAALGCACIDNNDNGACGDAGDTFIDDNDWLKGPTVGLGGNFAGLNFLLPKTCSVTITTAPKGGVVVNAAKITIRGSYISTPTGGEGTQFNATGDIFIDQQNAVDPRPHVESGGINKLVNNLANAAVAKSSVALRAGGACHILNADLRGNPIAASGQVGMQCNGDLDIHGSTVTAAGIDLQSLTGEIDAQATSGALPPIGIECDDPVKNLTANGNNNGVLDAGDFPCQLEFADQAAVAAVCIPEPPVTPNIFRALNNPLEMIAQTNLKLDSPTFPGNIVEGRFQINLVGGTGKVDTDNAVITNCDGCSPLGGAKIFVAANPATFTRFPVLKETWTGPSAGGNIELNGACYTSHVNNKVFYVTGDTLVGTPAAPPCKQLADFLAVNSGP